MQAVKMKAAIGENRTLSLTLPATVRPGMADVIVLLEEDETRVPAKFPSDSVFEELLHFGDGRRLDGLSIKEMLAEGRR